MRQKTEQETMAAERHITLLVDALEKAKSNGGVWMNPDGHPRAKMYPNGVNVSPFNALVMGLHADANEYKTPLYLSFNTAKDNDLSVRKGEKGVPFIWYNWDTFVNRENPEDKISRTTYNALPESVRENYKATQKREVRTVFNLDQTTFPHKEKEEYEKLQKEYGSSEQVGKDTEGLKTQVSHFILTMRDNLVEIYHDNEQANAHYDAKEDVVYVPNARNFSHYEDYVQDVMRQVMLATGYEQRLARVSRPTPEAMRQEALISELSAGIKMAELGLPARISKDNLEHIDFWKQELQENPCLIDILERDINRSLDLVSRAERGEKIEYASKVRKDLVEKLSTPEVNSDECAILLDIIRREGEIDPLNFRNDNARKAFIEKFGLVEYETDRQLAKAELSRPDISEDEKDRAEEALAKASVKVLQKCTESVPEKWNNQSHNFFVYPAIDEWMPQSSKHFGLVLDTKTRIADVILPTGANLKTGVPGTHTNERIAHALTKYMDASYVRFFNVDGFMGYKPDDNYFRNKEVSFQELKGWKIKETGRMQFDDALLKANTVIFDQAQMMKADDGKWAFYLKAHGEEGFAIYPSGRDVNQFFTTIQHGDDKAVNELRNELSQKYYIIGKKDPKARFDIFGMDAPKEDVARITKASIFRTKEGKLMIMPTIEGLGRQRPRELKQSQWQRLWLAPDMAAYRNHLAAKLYADVLHSEVNLKEGEKVTSPRRDNTPSMDASRKEVQDKKQEVKMEEKVSEQKKSADTPIVHDIPEWALSYIINGDASGLSDEEQQMVDEFLEKNFPDGFVPEVKEDSRNEFNLYPAFGFRNENALTNKGESPFQADTTVKVAFHPAGEMRVMPHEEEKEYEKQQQEADEQQADDKKTEKEEKEKEKEEQKSESKTALTPMVKQFLDLKKKHPDALLLFRCGDFYETYMQDAEKASKILGITLTKSSKTKGPDGKPLAMAGFPYHALNTYLPKLIRAGQRVAICDQIEAPKQTAKRGISEMVSPGASTEKEQKQQTQNEVHTSRGFHR